MKGGLIILEEHNKGLYIISVLVAVHRRAKMAELL